jgi:hypothetical protein
VRRWHIMIAALFFAAMSACMDTQCWHEVLGVDKIINSASALQGHLVTVSGYLRFGDDSHNLWSSKGALLAVSKSYVPPDDPAWTHCIGLFDIDGWRARLLALDNSYVIITGALQSGNLHHSEFTMNTCTDSGLSIRSAKQRNDSGM